jgi:hypothetical protein
MEMGNLRRSCHVATREIPGSSTHDVDGCSGWHVAQLHQVGVVETHTAVGDPGHSGTDGGVGAQWSVDGGDGVAYSSQSLIELLWADVTMTKGP